MGLGRALALAAVLARTFAKLDPSPGSIDGAWLDTDGLTDKQLALANWLFECENATQADGSWDWSNYGANGTQTGLTATRYALSFTGLAQMLQAVQHTPAYTETAEHAMLLTTSRFQDESVWHYWSDPDQCAPSWNQNLCDQYNASMCELDMYLWNPENTAPGLACPDPIGFGNIMFSAHV